MDITGFSLGMALGGIIFLLFVVLIGIE